MADDEPIDAAALSANWAAQHPVALDATIGDMVIVAGGAA